MGYELVRYKKSEFYMDNEIISWVQKFMVLYLLSKNHPNWFSKILDFMNWNVHMPHGKAFFDENDINEDAQRFDYFIKMIDLTLEKMEEFNKRTFFEYIENGIKGYWCEVNDSNVWGQNYQKWLNDNPDLYDDFCKMVLVNLKKIMLENAPS